MDVRHEIINLASNTSLREANPRPVSLEDTVDFLIKCDLNQKYVCLVSWRDFEELAACTNYDYVCDREGAREGDREADREGARRGGGEKPETKMVKRKLEVMAEKKLAREKEMAEKKVASSLNLRHN